MFTKWAKAHYTNTLVYGIFHLRVSEGNLIENVARRKFDLYIETDFETTKINGKKVV